MQRYTCRDFHGEVKTKSNTFVSNYDAEYNNDSNNNNRDNLNEMLPNLEGNTAKKNHDQSQQLFVDSETPLYEGCEDFTKLSATYRLMNVKAINGWSDTGFTSLLEALQEMFPKAKLHSSTYQAKKLICPMGMKIEKIDACPKDCMLYRDNDKDLHACRICGKSRYKREKDTPLNPDVTKNGPPAKILWYLLIKPRLERLFSNEKDAKLLRWHAEERKRDGKMRHVSDSLQWRNIDNEFKEFGDEIRNIRFGQSRDKFWIWANTGCEISRDGNELALVDPLKRKKRGPAKLKDKPTELFKVDFDKNGCAIGKHQNDWATYVGGMSRLRILIVADDWSKIEQDQKDALWEIIKKKRAIRRVYAKQQTNYAHLGRSGYRGRSRNWILARITSPNISTNMEELFRKLVDVDKKIAQGLIPKEKGADSLIVVLGPEHGGRTRMVRDGIGFRKGKLAQRDAKRDEKIDAQRDAKRYAARDVEIEVESENVEREASNEGRLQKRRKQSSCESTTIVHQEQLKDIKEPKSCMLFCPFTEDKNPIARGMVYPIGDDFGGTKLPVSSKADDTITLKQQCVKDAYTRWTSRDDYTADHLFEVPSGINVGHEDTFNVPISTKDIMKL
ncbi:hypothetical protein Tco_0291222 [Tanacetum coccineum]